MKTEQQYKLELLAEFLRKHKMAIIGKNLKFEFTLHNGNRDFVEPEYNNWRIDAHNVDLTIGLMELDDILTELEYE